MATKKNAKSSKKKRLSLSDLPERWRELLSEFVRRDNKKQALREWCKERNLPESTAYKWITAETVKLEEKLQGNADKYASEFYDDLPPRKAAFVDHYVTDFNGTSAAKKAGYSESSANEQASRLLANDKVRKAIDERRIQIRNGTSISAKEILEQHARLALSSMKDFADWDNGRISLKDSKTLPDELGMLVQEVSEGKEGVKIKLKDSRSSLMWLSQKLAAETEAENRIRNDVMDRLDKGEVTAQKASMELFRYGIDPPPFLSDMVKAELHLVEPPEEEIKPAPPKEHRMSMEEYAEFNEWRKSKAQDRTALMLEEIEKETRAIENGEA